MKPERMSEIPKTAEELAWHLLQHFEAMGNNEPFPRITTEQPESFPEPPTIAGKGKHRENMQQRFCINGEWFTITIKADSGRVRQP